MTEEEKKAIESIKELIYGNYNSIILKDTDGYTLWNEDFKTILNLIEKQQNKIASQEKQIKLMQSCDLAKEIKRQQEEIEELKEKNNKIVVAYDGKRYGRKAMILKDYISKDKIKEILGIEEDIPTERILSLLETLISEVNRLEDIEDKKVQVEVQNIERKRDKYWEDKIKEKIEKYEEDYKRQDKEELFNMTKITAGKLSALKELLEGDNK